MVLGLLPGASPGWFLLCGVRLWYRRSSTVAVARAWGNAPELEGTTPDGRAVGVFAFLTSLVLVLPRALRKRVGVYKAGLTKPTFVCGRPTVEGGRPSKMSILGNGRCVKAV